MTIQVSLDTRPNDQDVGLLAAAAEARFGHTLEELFVSPTLRLGMSGARVYRVRARVTVGRSRYYYAKVGKLSGLGQEYQAFRQYVHDILTHVADAWLVSDGEYACLSCFAVGMDAGAEPTPLVDKLGGASCQTSKMCKAIDRVFKKVLAPWSDGNSTEQIRWFEDYSWYLRWERTQEFLRDWLGDSTYNHLTGNPDPSGLASPLATILKLQEDGATASVRFRPVHGDLHQRNIILDSIGREFVPWVIDFGWTRRFHALVDYALLEASLKIFHFARFCTENRYLQIHDLLHERRRAASGSGGKTEPAMIRLIQTIRDNARAEVEPEAWPHEYYLSSLLVSMGLITIPTSLPRMAWLTAAWFAEHLQTWEDP